MDQYNQNDIEKKDYIYRMNQDIINNQNIINDSKIYHKYKPTSKIKK